MRGGRMNRWDYYVQHCSIRTQHTCLNKNSRIWGNKFGCDGSNLFSDEISNAESGIFQV